MTLDPVREPLHLRLAATPAAATVMRERLRLWLDAAGIDGAVGIDVIAACSEAFINAVEHPVSPTRPAVQVHAEVAGRTLMVTVRDYGRWGEGPPASDRDHFGYPLMHALTDRVDVTRSATGTTVTLRLVLH